MKLTDLQAMQLAIDEAKKGVGFVSPNPLVGCVILDVENNFLSKGFHSKYGADHAEIEALKNISGEKLKGARLFVTLEPCAHEGKTPSCAKALAKLNLSEVVYGLQDPNPLVCGQGIQILRDAGIKITAFAELQDELEELCEHFLENFRNKKIFISVKVASSLDGQMSLKNGESKWITGESARNYARYLRGAHDATLVGKNTVLLDNPFLNFREEPFAKKQNKIIIFDSNAEILQHPKLNIFKIHQPENIFLVTKKKLSSPMAHVLTVEGPDNSRDLDKILIILWDIGIRAIFIEGGADVISSFISQNKVDRLYLFQAPMLLGAKSGLSWTNQVIIPDMKQKIWLKKLRLQQFDQDLLITGRLR